MRGGAHVEFTQGEARLLTGKVLTHNHPSGRSFSREDIRLASFWDRAEIRVAGSRGYGYRMRPPANRPWTGDLWEKEIYAAYERHSIAVADEVGRSVVAGRVTRREAQYSLAHRVWTRVARETGLRYSRRRVQR